MNLRPDLYAASITTLAAQLGVSRQRVWQLRMRAEGRCVTCGDPAPAGPYCERHTLTRAAYERQRPPRRRKVAA